MTTERLFEIFVKQNTKNRDGVNPSAGFYRQYGHVSFEEAFEVYLSHMNSVLEIRNKVRDFENFLISSGCPCEQSKVSESRYYYWNGCKFRFSSHIYPTGSMTNRTLGVYDLAAEPELINEISY